MVKKDKDRALELCQGLALNHLGKGSRCRRLCIWKCSLKQIGKRSLVFLGLLFLKGTLGNVRWSRTYLKNQSSLLRIAESCWVSISDAAVDFLKRGESGSWLAFNRDIEDMFYLLPHDYMLCSPMSCII